MGYSTKWLDPIQETLQSAAGATGNGATLELGGKYGAVTAQVKGTLTSLTITFEISNDGGVTWTSIRGINKATGAGATTTTAAGIFTFSVSGVLKFRARVSAFATGSVTVIAVASPASEPATSDAITGEVSISQTTDGTTNKVRAFQPTHDNLNANANLQVNNADNAAGNPAFVQVTGSNTREWGTDTITIGTGAAHHAGDVVTTDAGEILQFETGLSAGQSGVILDSLVTLGQNAVFSGGAGYTLYLFSSSPTAQATNAAFDLADADLPKYIGKINISTLIDLGSNCAKTDVGHNLSFTLAVADTKLYGKAVCNGGETTVTGKVLTFNLGIAAL